MKSKKVNALISAALVMAITTASSTNVFAVEKSKAVDSGRVKIENNVGKKDVVKIDGLKDGEVIKIYTVDQLIATGTVPKGKTSIDIQIAQIGEEKGEIYITATEKDKLESDTIKKEYDAEGKSTKLDPKNVVVENNVGKQDTVTVSDLDGKDVVKVYADEGKRTLLGTGKPSKDGIALIKLSKQIDKEFVYVTVTNDNMQESEFIDVKVGEEAVTEAPTKIRFTVHNNAGNPDTVVVNGLEPKAVVKVYGDEKKRSLLGTATSSKGEELVVRLSKQLGEKVEKVYVTVANDNKRESEALPIEVKGEEDTEPLKLESVTVQNNAGNADTVMVTGLAEKDTVNVYTTDEKKTLLGTGKVQKNGTVIVKLSKQLGDIKIINITLTNENKRESKPITVEVSKEQTTKPLELDKVTVQNNAVNPDTVTVKGVLGNDTVKVYGDKEKKQLLGTAKGSKTDELVVKLSKQLDEKTQKIYVSLTNENKIESELLEVAVEKEAVTEVLKSENVILQNNAGIADVVTVKGLVAKDVIKVYADDDKKTLLGTAQASKDGELVIKLSKQLDPNIKNVKVTVASTNKRESEPLLVAVEPEKTTESLDGKEVKIVNNFSDDLVMVFGLAEGDTVKVYDADDVKKNPIGKAKVEKGQKLAIIRLKQLGKDGGKVFLTLTQDGKNESKTIGVDFDKE